MTNNEKYDLFVIELARGKYEDCQELINGYEPTELGEYFTKARMQRKLDGETGELEDWSSGTDYQFKHSKYATQTIPE